MLPEPFKVVLKDVVLDPQNEQKWNALAILARSTEVFGSRDNMKRESIEGIKYISEILHKNEPAWWRTLLKYAAYGVGLGVGAVMTAPLWLAAVGFGSIGVGAGTLAAWLMTSTTAAGGFFAACQSVGAIGWASSYLMTFLTYLVGTGAAGGAGVGGLQAAWNYFTKASPEQQRLLMAEFQWKQAVERAFPTTAVQ